MRTALNLRFDTLHVRRLLYGAGLGLILFLLSQIGAISGALAPPAGYEPAWTVEHLDFHQYITWLAAGRTRLLLPDFHAPWITEASLFQPLFLLAGLIPLPPVAAYQLASLLSCMVSGAALVYASSVFCPDLERYALLASACALPFPLLALAFGKIELGYEGIVHYSYETADGLFRGGLSTTLTLSVGTTFVLISMAMLARYLESGRRGFFLALTGVTFLSALLHPFEVFLIVAASAAPLLLARRIKEWISVGVAGFLGILPYVVLSARSAWQRDIAEQLAHPVYPFAVLVNYGLPFVLVVYLLLMRFRMPRQGDRVLQSWFLATLALGIVPGVPFALHLFNGFAYCAGFLLVRRVAVDRQLVPLIQRRRHLALTVLTGVAALSAVSLLVLYQQLWKDGRRAQPELLVSAVRPVSEPPVIEWLRSHGTPDSLVLSPPDMAPWIASIPMVSFGSHFYSSVTFMEQSRLAEAFYRGEDVERKLIENYGVRIAVVPDSSPALQHMRGALLRESIGPWRIYEFPGAHMKPYPGLAALNPGSQISLRSRTLQRLASLLRL